MRFLFKVVCCIVLIPCAVCNAIVPFEPYRQYPTGSDSTGIVVADVDGDGYLDLIVSNRGTEKSSDVSILINNGLGLFPSTTNYLTGSVPRYVDGADFDGDGDFDICTSDYIGMTTTILENDGNGVFSILAQHSMDTPAFLWVDDIDSDGYQDILVLHWDEDAVDPAFSPALFLPLLNNGDGSFTAAPTSWIGRQPRCGASADLNGDGILDVVTANYNSQDLSIVMGLGKGQWADGLSFPLSGNLRYLVLEDLDDDGDIDIAVIDRTDKYLWIIQNDGSANFMVVETYTTNDNPHSIAAGDVDLDGDIDLIVTHVSSAEQLLFLNNGDGTFPIIQNVIMHGGPAEVKFADINNDGDLDIVTANVNHNERGTTVILQGTCKGTDCNDNGIGDVCDLPDCNYNSVPDECDIADGTSQDCNENGIPDECDIAVGSSPDFNNNGIPDECDPDCNENGYPDFVDIEVGASLDCNDNEIPDECDIEDGTSEDCNNNEIPDECDIEDGTSDDLCGDDIPDECQCLADTVGNGFVDVQDLLSIIGAWDNDGGPEDINCDGSVDTSDLLIVIGAWGPCS